MTDVVTPAKRRQMMSGIKGKHSLPEMLVRKVLFAIGYRFRLHLRDLPMPSCVFHAMADTIPR